MRAQQGQLGRGEAGRVPPGRVSPPRPGQARVPPPAGSCACPSGQCHQAGSQERRPRGGRVGAVGDRAAAGLLAGWPDGRGQPELRLLRHQPLLPARGPRGRRPPLRPHHPAAALPRRRVPPHRLPRLPGKTLCLLGAGPGRREPGRGPLGGWVSARMAGRSAEAWARPFGRAGHAGPSPAGRVSGFHRGHDALGAAAQAPPRPLAWLRTTTPRGHFSPGGPLVSRGPTSRTAAATPKLRSPPRPTLLRLLLGRGPTASQEEVAGLLAVGRPTHTEAAWGLAARSSGQKGERARRVGEELSGPQTGLREGVASGNRGG